MEALMQYIWGAVIWILWSGFIVLAGSDLGIGVLQPFAKPKERQTYLQAIGPMWGGNQVWFVTAAGATFASFPVWYATLFSGTVVPLTLLVCMLILRGVAIEWGTRSAGKSTGWMETWSKFHAISAALALATIGMIFAALVKGMELAVVNPGTLARAEAAEIDPFVPAGTQVQGFIHYNVGGPWQPFSWYTAVGAVAVLIPLIVQGAYFLAVRSQGKVRVAHARVAIMAILGIIAAIAWFVLGYLFFDLNLVLVTACSAIFLATGGLAIVASRFNKRLLAWILNSISLITLPTIGLYGHFPYLMKSVIDTNFSLTLANSASTTSTLMFISIMGAIIIPLVLVYTTWGYWVTRTVADPTQIRRSLPFDEVLMK